MTLLVVAASNCPFNMRGDYDVFDLWVNGRTPDQPIVVVGGIDILAGSAPEITYSTASAYGADGIDIAASHAVNTLNPDDPNDYKFVEGNSFATPLVAGAAGLMVSNDPSLSGQGAKLKSRLLCNANKLNLTQYVKDGNTLDAFAAVTNAHGCP